MHKSFKITLSIFTALAVVILSCFAAIRGSAAQPPANGDVRLVYDSLSSSNMLPKNFRKTTNLDFVKNNPALNLKGLDKLNISGSQQFSEYNLPLLLKAINTPLHITVMDLRQESHGFINGFAVSWADSKNNANAGLTREQVLEDEAKKLAGIRLNVPVTIYGRTTETIVPTSVQDENQLASSNNLSYNRVTVRDGGIPTDDMVDYFVESVKSLPKDSWLHFHCKAGVGRTTTFMIMYDMLKNFKNASADEIVRRQLALANYKEKVEESFYNPERIRFLNKFYDYCRANGDNFNIKWSEFNLLNFNSFFKQHR